MKLAFESTEQYMVFCRRDITDYGAICQNLERLYAMHILHENICDVCVIFYEVVERNKDILAKCVQRYQKAKRGLYD